MVQAKRIYLLIIKVNELFSFFVMVFSNRNRKHVFLASVKLWKHLKRFGRTQKSCGNESTCVPTAVLILPNVHSRSGIKWLSAMLD